MGENKLVVLERMPDAMSAYALRNRLEAAGIFAVVEGAESNITLSYVGSALGGVKVLVPQDQLTAARNILADRRDPSDDVPDHDWICQRCFSEVDAGFAICWKCGTPFRPAEP
ncbi:MAG: hypothetical protein KatS3mg111_2895 [Pirellulaceae bacterium]|nr:MAG: hypothetical protein KatS3mg111_2895 [Pirellulaceae bacterium]